MTTLALVVQTSGNNKTYFLNFKLVGKYLKCTHLAHNLQAPIICKHMVTLLDSITPFNHQENSVKASILYGHIVVLNLMYDIKIPMECDSLYLERLYKQSKGKYL